MIPKPPFAWELTPERELQEFEHLKLRLAGLWHDVFARRDQPYTSVVVPSVSLDSQELAKIKGVAFYEERLLFLLIQLRNPFARMVYVTSQPIHPLVLEYYLQLLAGVPASHARDRLTLLCAHDSSSRPLTQKIVERPRLIQRIREALQDRSRSYLTVFNSTPLERRLAVLLGIPLNGLDPELARLGTKSGSRRVFREAEVDCPPGVEDVRTEQDVLNALGELRRSQPGLRRAVLKLDDSFAGEGNAVLRYPVDSSRDALRQALDELQFSVPTETVESYLAKMERKGGVVEEVLEGREHTSPSAQLRIDARGEVEVSSTHEQILGGSTGHLYRGCTFPARGEYRAQLQEMGMRVGRVLAGKGVVSRFSVDFLIRRDDPGAAWNAAAVEINLRMGGTTHPMLALLFLTGGCFDLASGLFHCPAGRAKYYRATDGLSSPSYVGLLPEDLIEIVTVNHLDYSYRTATGVLFHMIGAISEFGKVGLVAIGNSPQEAEEIFARTTQVLDRETAYRGPPAGP